MSLPQILTPKQTYTFDYPEAIKFAETQQSIFWSPEEIKVEKDVQDILVNMTPAEKHGVITVLKLFTLYELRVGEEYWGEFVRNTFPRPDVRRMANCFSFFELNVHAPFYNKINEALYLNTDDFYNSYTKDKVLSERIQFIDEGLLVRDKQNPIEVLRSIGTFSMVEGGVLYANFGYLKHFQALGKNKLNAIVSGINFSVRDENLHAEGGIWLYKTLLSEARISKADLMLVTDSIVHNARIIQEHEHRIIDMIFEAGPIEGITAQQLKTFINDRLNYCLSNLGLPKMFEVGANPIAEWFFRNINSMRMHDFFVRTGNQYHRKWSAKSFTWKTDAERQQIGNVAAPQNLELAA